MASNRIHLTRIAGLLERLRLWPFVVAVVSFGAVLAAVVAGVSVVTSVFFAGSFVMIVARTRERLKLVLHDVGPLGTYMVGRFVLLSVAVVSAGFEGQESPLILVSAGAIAMVLASESVLRTLHGRAKSRVANVPGIAVRTDAGFGYGLIFVAATIAVALAYVASFGQLWALAILTVAAAVAFILACAACWDTVIKNRARQSEERALRRKLTDMEPLFVVYWHAPANSVHQISMWLPYLERLDIPYFIITRSRRNFQDVCQITERPVVLCRNTEDLDDVIVPSLRTAFYVNHDYQNSQLVRFAPLIHVQLNQDDFSPEVSLSPNSRKYNKTFVAGQAAIDRFAANGVAMPESMFSIVGRPQVEDVRIAEKPIEQVPGPTVLYAPTWAGFNADANYSSLQVGHHIISSLIARGCTIIFRSHPFTDRSPALAAERERIQQLLADDTQTNGRQHIFGDTAEKHMSIYDCFNTSDAMIADVSSVVGDYLYSQKPFATVAISTPADTFAEQFPMSRAGYIIDAHKNTLTNLEHTLNQLLNHDPLKDTRRELKAYYLGDIPHNTYTQHFINEALTTIHTTHPIGNTTTEAISRGAPLPRASLLKSATENGG